MNRKYQYLLKNVGLLTISKFGTSILTFFLVPLYTAILTTEEYGIFELINTTVSLLIPILTINIAVAVFRFSIDDKEHWADTFSIGIKYLIIGTAVLLLLLGINWFSELYKPFKQYSHYIFLLFIFSALSEIIGYFARGQEKIKEISISGIIGTGTIVLFNVLFLLVFQYGIDGYFWAILLGYAVPTLYLCIVCDTTKYVKMRPSNDKMKEMTTYSKPMIANTIGWWINNVSSRYIVTVLCGIAANGIYSVAYKIPSILTVIQIIFSQAWTLSAVKDFDKEDKSGFFSQIYNLYNFSNVLGCSILIATSKIIAAFLYQKDFYDAWHYVPFLLISVVFGSLAGFFGSIYSAVKESKMYAKSTVIGAAINIALTFIFIYFFGVVGAAVATAISFFVVYLIRLFDSRKYIHIFIPLKRDYISYLILFLQAVVINAISNATTLVTINIIAVMALFFLFAPEEKMILDRGYNALIKYTKNHGLPRNG